MIEKNFLLINFFCHQIFQILIYFLCENCNLPLFPRNPLQKLKFCQATPFFENLVGGSIPPPPAAMGGTHYDLCVMHFQVYLQICSPSSFFKIVAIEVRNSRVRKSSYETKLHKITSHFELMTRKFL